jgi:hypothetical protein
MNNKRGLRKEEKALLFLACCLTLGSAYFYKNNKIIQSFFLPNISDSLVVIGKVQSKTGKIQRENAAESGFIEMIGDGTLYDNDTILTSQNSSAVVKLNDDGELNLGPNTMIRLNLDSSKDSNGQYRTYQVEVLNGEVTAQNSGKNEKAKVFLKSKSERVAVGKGQTQTLAAKKEQKPKELPPVAAVKVAEPLPLIVKIQATPTPTATPKPTPRPVVKPKPALKAIVVNKPAPKVKAFPVVTKAVQKPAIQPPETICPQKGLNISISKNIPLQNGKKELLLTWKSVSFDDYYEVQISRDQNFTKIIETRQSQANFHSINYLNPGFYWWRVKVISKQGSSNYSAPFWFRLYP